MVKWFKCWKIKTWESFGLVYGLFKDKIFSWEWLLNGLISFCVQNTKFRMLCRNCGQNKIFQSGSGWHLTLSLFFLESKFVTLAMGLRITQNDFSKFALKYDYWSLFVKPFISDNFWNIWKSLSLVSCSKDTWECEFYTRYDTHSRNDRHFDKI